MTWGITTVSNKRLPLPLLMQPTREDLSVQILGGKLGEEGERVRMVECGPAMTAVV